MNCEPGAHPRTHPACRATKDAADVLTCYIAAMAVQFNGVKVFSATMYADRGQLGERVSAWIAANPKVEIVDVVVSQSSDASFHCIAITVFYWS